MNSHLISPNLLSPTRAQTNQIIQYEEALPSPCLSFTKSTNKQKAATPSNCRTRLWKLHETFMPFSSYFPWSHSLPYSPKQYMRRQLELSKVCFCLSQREKATFRDSVNAQKTFAVDHISLHLNWKELVISSIKWNDEFYCLDDSRLSFAPVDPRRLVKPCDFHLPAVMKPVWSGFVCQYFLIQYNDNLNRLLSLQNIPHVLLLWRRNRSIDSWNVFKKQKGP